MARLIVKSPYFKGGGAKPAGGYLRYIATRERVEILPDDRPPTKRQTQLIEKLTKDFPDTKTLLEYGDYAAHPTKFNASQFLTLAVEENWGKVQELDGYAKYIATRPRAERLGEHGLFGDEDAVDLNAAMAEVNSYTGNIWTHIISLRREDAERLGFDHADAWRALLRAHRNDIAEAMHIPPEDFRWYAAFHDEGSHPHIHMMAWSKKPGQAYLNREGIRKIKSVLTNQIFQQELLHIYEDKSQSRDELVRETRSAMLALAQKMQNSACEHPEAEQMIWELARELGSVKGKKSYGYLPKDLKQKVDAIVDQMELLPSVYECYYELFLLDLATGLRRGELLALQWNDLDFETGVLTISKQVSLVRGKIVMSVPKTKSSIRKLVLPPAVVQVLKEYRESVHSRWMFPSPVLEDMPLNPGSVYDRLQLILEHANCKQVRFHDLRHTFATLALQNGMDVKTLSAMLGHVSAATTLDIYTHSTSDMQHAAARKIDCGIGKAELPDEPAPQANAPAIVDFQPYMGKVRKPGTGCISQINDHLFEGRYSPTWIDGKKHARNVYAHTREECEEKLKVLIAEMKAELAELKRQKADRH